MANLKKVRVIAGPTGPTGTFKGVRILAAFTGPTGAFAQWQQINPQQAGTGMTGPVGGRYETVYPVSAGQAAAQKGVFQTVIITGYTGPA